MRDQWIVFGGEMKTVGEPVLTGMPRIHQFRDPGALEFVGAYADEAAAKDAWKARAQATVDNAHMRFFVTFVSGDARERGMRPGSVNQKLQAFIRGLSEPKPFNLDPLDF